MEDCGTQETFIEVEEGFGDGARMSPEDQLLNDKINEMSRAWRRDESRRVILMLLYRAKLNIILSEMGRNRRKSNWLRKLNDTRVHIHMQ